MKLAVERRARLEESRKLWQFYWDMADEENWIKEKEQIVSTTEIGHDLTTINLLLSKHKVVYIALITVQYFVCCEFLKCMLQTKGSINNYISQ